MFFFFPPLLFFFFHAGCTNNRWLWCRPVEGRHIQIQGHSLPLFHQRNCKCECKLLAVHLLHSFSSTFSCAPVVISSAFLLPVYLHYYTLISDPPPPPFHKRPALAVLFWTCTCKESACIFQTNNTSVRYFFLCYTSSWGCCLCLFMK